MKIKVLLWIYLFLYGTFLFSSSYAYQADFTTDLSDDIVPSAMFTYRYNSIVGAPAYNWNCNMSYEQGFIRISTRYAKAYFLSLIKGGATS